MVYMINSNKTKRHIKLAFYRNIKFRGKNSKYKCKNLAVEYKVLESAFDGSECLYT